MSDWKWCELGTLAELRMGQSPPGNTVKDLEHGLPFLQGNAEFGANSPHARYQCDTAPRRCEAGDTLLSVRAPVGAINKADQRYGIGRGLASIRFKEVLPSFGHHALSMQARALHRVSQGTTFAAIGRAELEELRLPCPPEKEQRRIAEVLDTIDEAIQATEHLIAKHADLARGIQDNVLGVRNWHPQQTGNLAIGDLAVHVGSGVTPTGGAAVYSESGVLFVRSQNVHSDGLRLDDIAFIPQSVHDSMKRSALEPWDVLYNITGASIGRCAVFPSHLGPANVNQHVCAIRLPGREPYDSTFLAAVLASEIGRRQLRALNAGSNREGLNYKQLRSFQVPWPSAELRHRAAKAIETSGAAINSLRDEEALLRGIRAGLAADLLSGRVRTVVS